MVSLRVIEYLVQGPPKMAIWRISGETSKDIKARLCLPSVTYTFTIRNKEAIQSRILTGDVKLYLWDETTEKYIAPTWQVLFKTEAISDFPRYLKLFCRRMQDSGVDFLNVVNIQIARPVGGKGEDNMFSNYTFPCCFTSLSENETYLLMKSIIPPEDADNKKRKI